MSFISISLSLICLKCDLSENTRGRLVLQNISCRSFIIDLWMMTLKRLPGVYAENLECFSVGRLGRILVHWLFQPFSKACQLDITDRIFQEFMRGSPLCWVFDYCFTSLGLSKLLRYFNEPRESTMNKGLCIIRRWSGQIHRVWDHLDLLKQFWDYLALH